MTYQRRMGDARPLKRDSASNLTWRPGRPVRWLPRHGDPFCVIEWMSQKTIKSMAYLPVYTAVVITLVLLVLIFGVPFVESR